MSVEDLIRGVIVDIEKRIAKEKAEGNSSLAMALSCAKIPLEGLLEALPECSSVMSKEKNE